jgi:hypothetical protein
MQPSNTRDGITLEAHHNRWYKAKETPASPKTPEIAAPTHPTGAANLRKEKP